MATVVATLLHDWELNCTVMLIVPSLRRAVRWSPDSTAIITAHSGDSGLESIAVNLANQCNIWLGGRVVAYSHDTGITKALVSVHRIANRSLPLTASV